MKSLYESIISSNNAGVKHIDNECISNYWARTTLNDVLDMSKMYKDAEEITGDDTHTHASAFAAILCSPHSFISDKAYAMMKNPDKGYSIDDVDADFKRLFEKYLKDENFNFYIHPNHFKQCELGILIKNKKGRYVDKPILDLNLK